MGAARQLNYQLSSLLEAGSSHLDLTLRSLSVDYKCVTHRGNCSCKVICVENSEVTTHVPNQVHRRPSVVQQGGLTASSHQNCYSSHGRELFLGQFGSTHDKVEVVIGYDICQLNQLNTRVQGGRQLGGKVVG